MCSDGAIRLAALLSCPTNINMKQCGLMSDYNTQDYDDNDVNMLGA